MLLQLLLLLLSIHCNAARVQIYTDWALGGALAVGGSAPFDKEPKSAAIWSVDQGSLARMHACSLTLSSRPKPARVGFRTPASPNAARSALRSPARVLSPLPGPEPTVAPPYSPRVLVCTHDAN